MHAASIQVPGSMEEQCCELMPRSMEVPHCVGNVRSEANSKPAYSISNAVKATASMEEHAMTKKAAGGSQQTVQRPHDCLHPYFPLHQTARGHH